MKNEIKEYNQRLTNLIGAKFMPTKSFDLSVIVTCYNLQGYLADCLDSIEQTDFPKDNMEVLMVDDGSTDQTPQIVDQYAAKYPNFHALHKENGGPSLARNYGMDHAHGKYIAFVDGDDLVPENAYTDLVYTAEAHHSDVVSGAVRRFDNLRDQRSYLHKLAIPDTTINTTLDRSHSLLYDTTTWNKVYDFTFLKRNHLRFIPHIIYEDLPFTLQVHLASQRTSMIKEEVYNWRWRSNSITNTRNALDNFKSRLSSLKRCRTYLEQAGYHRGDSMMHDFLWKVLSLDLHIYLDNIGDSEESYIYRVQELTFQFLRDWHLIDSPLLQKLPLKDQIKYYAIKTGNLELLKKYTYVSKREVGFLKCHHLTHHYQLMVPGLDQKVIDHLDARDNTLPVTQRLHAFDMDHQTHEVMGSGMFRILHTTLVKHRHDHNNYREHLSAQLVNLDNGQTFPVRFARTLTKAYKRLLRPSTTWTNARYAFNFDYQAAAKKLGGGTWQLMVTDNLDGFVVKTPLGWPQKEDKKLLAPVVTKHFQIKNDFNTQHFLVFRVIPRHLSQQKVVDWIQKPVISGHHLIFQAHFQDPTAFRPVIYFDKRSSLEGTVMTQGDRQQISFDLTAWPHFKSQVSYQLRLLHRRTNRIVPYHFPARHPEQILSENDQKQVLVTYDQREAIQVAYQIKQFQVVKCQLLPHHQALRITAKTTLPNDFHEWATNHFKITLLEQTLRHRYVYTTDNDYLKFAHHQLTFDIPLVSADGKQLNLLQGHYHLLAYLPVNDSQNLRTGFVIPKKLIMKQPKVLPMKSKDSVDYQLMANAHGAMEIMIHQNWRGLNKSRAFRALGYTLIYPFFRLLPLRKTVLFNAYWGHQFSSNERSIYQYFAANYPKYRLVWLFHNRQTPITGSGKRDKINSLRYWYDLATAKYIFQNANLPNEYFKRPGQIEVETLHGTFLKHMGFDEPHFREATRNIQDKFARRISRWDYMVVPSNYMAKTASAAFDYHHKLIRAGFPRNDELVYHNNATYIKAIKKRLHIPLNKKVILYAPTYRKDDKDENFTFPLDLDRFQKHLVPNYVLLVRLHYMHAHQGNFFSNPGFVYDVSDYADINDLFLISDALVTDYSSVMFDYSALKRPMIFYAFDKQMYLQNRNRGTYLDYDHQMPGPIVQDQATLEQKLLHLDQVKKQYAPAIKKFADKFAEYGQKGDATAKVVHTVLQTKASDLNQIADRHVIFDKFWHLFRIDDFQSTLLNWLGQILPKRNIIMFESFFGHSFSDNPKAIYEYIKKHYPKYKLYWNVNPEYASYFKQHQIPYIKRFSYHGIFKQAQAKYWITNCRRPFRWMPPKHTIVLQTWHGTPLKTIGSDVQLVTMPGNNALKYHEQVYVDNRRWNYLLAPNEYSNQIMQRCFRKNANQMMLTGYPRNDILVNGTSADVKRIKHNLGIDPHKKVILYAPTWRDDEFVKSDEFIAHLHLDLAKFQKHYGDKVVVLVRTHYMIANHLDLSKYQDIAMNVSDYPDIADLYLISDVLITDYSSVMFDYAILKRPMIFFDYDFANYAQSTRGFYFDFRKVAPGPIVQTTDQVIAKLDPILAGKWQLSPNYRKFIKKFCGWMDGYASARVVHELFSGQHIKLQKLDRQTLQLPTAVELRDGALLWSEDKDFLNRFDVHFVKNYNYDGRPFKVLRGLQMRAIDVKTPLGQPFVLVQDPKTHQKLWVAKADIITSQR